MQETADFSLAKSRTSQFADAVWYKRKRYWVIVLLSLGKLIRMMLKTNLSIAIVEMTTSSHMNKNGTYIQESEFKWSSTEKGLILSCFFWGSLFSFCSTFLTEKFGGSQLLVFEMAFNGILTILSPILIRLNVTAFIIARACEGLTEALSSAAFIEILLYWIPPQERSRLTAGAFSGIIVGPAVAFPLCGIITKFYGWEATFFASGAVSILWSIIWWIFVPRTPATDQFISENEKNFLAKQVNISPANKLKYPWKKIFTSKPVWAYINERFVHSWSISFILDCLPIYIQDNGNINTDEIGYISSLPHISAFFAMIGSGYLADYLRNKQTWSISDVHKVLIACGQIGCVILLIIISIWKNFVGSIICLCALKMVITLAEICYLVLPNDMGQQYSCLIYGLSVSFFGIGHILNPILMGLFVSNHTTTEWSIYFIFLCSFNLWATVIFCLFGSGELEPWAAPDKNDLEQKCDQPGDHVSSEKSLHTNHGYEKEST